MDGAVSIEDVLSREIIRKLRLATEAENREDREIVCEEVFCDITGQLDEGSKAKLVINRPASFYEVLAPYYMRDTNAADTVLYFCKRLWGNLYVAPILSLLLHRWLLLRPEAGGMEQRQKHTNVLMYGCRRLFLGDVQAGIAKFQPLHSFMLHEVVLAPNRQPLDSLPAAARTNLLAAIAAFLPYYEPAKEVKLLLEDFPSSTHTLTEGGHLAGEGADFVIGEVTDTIMRVGTEEGLLTYLTALKALGGPEPLRHVRTITRLRLQSELYSLTSPGGPHYAPRRVRQAASEVLDALFPLGRRTRHLLRLLFRLLHPAEWLGDTVMAPLRWANWGYTWMLRHVLGVPVGIVSRLVSRSRRRAEEAATAAFDAFDTNLTHWY